MTPGAVTTLEPQEVFVRQVDSRFRFNGGTTVNLLHMAKVLPAEQFRQYIEASRVVRARRGKQ